MTTQVKRSFGVKYSDVEAYQMDKHDNRNFYFNDLLYFKL